MSRASQATNHADYFVVLYQFTMWDLATMTNEIYLLRDSKSLADFAAELLREKVDRHEKPRPFSVALSGGSTPKAMFERIAQQSSPAWSKVAWFWGDERNVPADHAESNFRMTRESLLEPLGIDPSRIHRIRTELGATQAAADYESLLRTLLEVSIHGLPVFDLVFLGLGDDAHTASLFPFTSALSEKSRWVVCNYVEKLNTDRITITAPVINAAKLVVFLVSGSNKSTALSQIWNGPRDPNQFPAQLVHPESRLIWLVDQSAYNGVIAPGDYAIRQIE